MARPLQHFVNGCLLFSLWACMEIRQIVPPKDPPLIPGANSSCKAPTIEQNIIGTWHFDSNRSPCCSRRQGSVTFDNKGNIIDPDSLFENHINGISSSPTSLDKVEYKTYDANAVYPYSVSGYNGKIFMVEVGTKNSRNWVKWPMYVYSNECNRIVINQLSTYDLPNKLGFTLTR